MRIERKPILTLASAALLTACAGQPETYTMNSGQSVTMPKGTMTGSASVGDANALAQMVVDDNANAMAQFDKLNGNMNRMQATETQQLQASQEALTKLEQLSDSQGSGQLTLFFGEGSARLDQEQQQRLIQFLDYIARDNRGRKVILVSVGSASALGPAAVNRKLSIMRSMSPLGVIEQYLVNTPHEFYKVSSVGDMYAPKNASAGVEQRYQNVRIIAAYNESLLSSS